MTSRKGISTLGSIPILSRSSLTAVRSSTRITMLSPNMVGSTETRRSTWLPPTLSSMRPSCGRRRSVMSRFAMTLIRLLMAEERARGGGTSSWSTPSAFMRTRYSSSNGSKCTSEALSRMAIRKIMLMRRRTGAESAISRALSRSMLPCLPPPERALLVSSSLIRSMMLSSLVLL